jgi:3-hydroxyacyl-CoA dehydrogenase / 3-hydroxy-2-methylbutyryl-CoA dehydrogenase
LNLDKEEIVNLQHKVTVITGGASGLGRRTVEYFVAEKDAKVAIFDLSDEVGVEIVAQLGPDKVIYCRVDVTDEAAVAAAVARVVDKFGRIDVCINCAGIGMPMKMLDKEGRASAGCGKFAKVVAVNLVGSFNVMAHCVAAMAGNAPENAERGVVINVASGAAFDGQVGQSAYSSSKAGVVGLSLPVARELAGLGIRVNAIAPGLFNTPMVAALPPPVVENLVSVIQFPKRFGDMREFAHACAFLCENTYANGECLRLDAAARLPPR